MKRVFGALLAVALAFTVVLPASAATKEVKGDVTVGSYNILIQPYGDSQHPNNLWSDRKQVVADYVNSDTNKLDVVGLQEARYAAQRSDLMSLLSSDWRMSTDDKTIANNAADENVILWRDSTQQLLKQGKEKIWDAAPYTDPEGTTLNTSNCYMSWVQLKDRKSGVEYYVFNTHLQYNNGYVRTDQVEKALPAIAKVIDDKNSPVLFTGDFNARPEHLATKAVLDGGYKDSRVEASTSVNSQYATFQNFRTTPTSTTGNIIDHIFYSPATVTPNYYITDISNMTGSDHLPIYGRFTVVNTVTVADPPASSTKPNQNVATKTVVKAPNTGEKIQSNGAMYSMLLVIAAIITGVFIYRRKRQ